YFSYDPYQSPMGVEDAPNWQKLRGYLNQTVDDIVGGRRTPEWCELLQLHTNLFTDSPATRYGPKLLDGDTSEVDALRGTLGIGDASWFMQRLYLSQIEAAYAFDDDAFLQILNRLLE